MAKLTKRLLIICLAVLTAAALGVAGFVMATTPDEEPVCYRQGDLIPDDVITKDDAIYLLYATIPMFKDTYPLNQNCDFRADQSVDKEDALYLLGASIPLTAPNYPLAERVHNYHSPVWTWDETAGTATAKFLCGCGEPHEETVTFTRTVTREATCTEAGAATLTAALTFGGKDYAPQNQTVIPATGHDMTALSCQEDSVCKNGCGNTIAATGHKMVRQNSSVAATCSAPGNDHYACVNTGCDHTQDVSLAQLNHSLTYLQGQDRKVEGTTCTYVKQYKCDTCTNVFDGQAATDTYVKHTYITKLTKEADCTNDGEMKTVCSACQAEKENGTEVLPADPQKHAWDNGQEQAGKMVYTCKVCFETKTEVIAGQDGAVNTADLDTDTGVSLGEKTSLTMDQNMLNGLGEQQINITVTPKNKDEITIAGDEDGAKKEQIPSDTVYDFNMTDANGKDVPFTGYVTISLPYTLEPGEDINSIDIWYISDAGEAERVDGTYSNGFVTFTTNHFSYYTVTRLNPAERCARLGSHIEIHQNKAATCTEDGYDMTLCQRCGQIISKTDVKKLGHDYKATNEVQATCTVAGSLTEVCQRSGCGHTVSRTEPAKGHKMVVDSTKSATCTEAGQVVTKCENGCGVTTTETLAQLEHSYQKDAENSKSATCSEGGYDLTKCSCGAEKKENEVLPLGHSYVATWNWADDGLSAEVTITCDNKDCTFSKVMTNPAITKDEDASQNQTCLGAGATLYRGKIVFNNNTYESSKEITIAAAGHKPGTEMVSSSTQHYYECTVCHEKVNAENHSWDDGVVAKEPTCVESGKTTLTCQVCQYEKEQVLPATGEHTYDSEGKCTVCGFSENSCLHIKMHKTSVDLSAYDICDGLEIIHFSCDCGQKSYYNYFGSGCSFGEHKESETVDKYGSSVYTYTATCQKCGLVRVEIDGREIDEEACVGTYSWKTSFILNGQTIADCVSTMMAEEHPYVILTETVRLTKEAYGLCGEILERRVCPCGEITGLTISQDSVCDWRYEWVEGSYDSKYVCAECGAVRIESYEDQQTEDPCKTLGKSTYTYYVNGEKVFSLTDENLWDDHDFELTGTKMLGSSCTDGVLIYNTCKDCGYTEDRSVTYHEALIEEVVDVTDADVCFDYLIQGTCLCDKQIRQYWTRTLNENYCSWQSQYDPELGWHEVCQTCQAKRITKTTYGEKDEECNCLLERNITYIDKNGNVIATGVDCEETVNHNMNQEHKLVEGAKSCEDGVIFREYCADCDYEWIRQTQTHECVEVQSYDLSDFNACNTRAYVDACACGENAWLNYDGQGCSWTFVNGAQYSDTYRCTECGIQRTTSWTDTDTDNPCQKDRVYTVELSKEGVETLRISYSRKTTSHDNIHTLTLLPGAADCDGGFMTTSTCQRCADTSTWGPNYGHMTYTVSKQTYSGLCSDMVIRTTDCACGQNSYTGRDWAGKPCSFDDGTYSSEDRTWTYTCTDCGGSYVYTSATEPVEGETCKYKETDAYTYYGKDGKELFSYTIENIITEHDEISTFRMLGTTCADGYYVDSTCTECEYVTTGDQLYTGCGYFDVERKVLYSNDQICGDVVLRYRSCPCGIEKDCILNYPCDTRHEGWDDEIGDDIYTCVDCGLQFIGGSYTSRLPGTCMGEGELEYTLKLDGQVVATLQETYPETMHRYVTTYNFDGQSCTDGYTLSRICAYCNDSEYWVSPMYNHESRLVGLYNMADYGACGGELYVYQCACGENASNGWEDVTDGCQWDSTGKTDAEGYSEYHCEECGLYRYNGEQGQRDENTCTYTGVWKFKLTDGQKVLLELTQAAEYESHDDKLTGVSLETPGTTCDQGVIVHYTCRDCQRPTTGTSTGHVRYIGRVIDLAALGSECGGTIEQTVCACGKYSEYSMDTNCDMSYKQDSKDNGTSGHEWTKATCQVCDLELVYGHDWTADAQNCTRERIGSFTATLGSGEESFPLHYLQEDHDYAETVTLQDGAKDCEDGVRLVQVCRTCGDKEEYTEYYHHQVAAQVLDLTEYGAAQACGGSLIRYSCACGKNNRYDFSADSGCDLDEKQITLEEMGIQNAMEYDYQYTTDGYREYYSDAYTLTCAVTDPKCSLKLRMAEYWVLEGCVATEYQLWQYYDAASQQWVELDQVTTGYTGSYHDYTETAVSETQSDGTKVQGTKYDCACGSYYHELTYTYTDGSLKDVIDSKDTTGANTNASRQRVVDYQFYNKGSWHITKTREDHVTTRGEAGWEQYDYTYDLEKCQRSYQYTNSYGGQGGSTEDHFNAVHSSDSIEGRTCTQYGRQKWEKYCKNCEKVVDSGYYRYDPYGHSFQDDGTCYYCGLESSNGATGSIVLEDMTESHGNGTYYVVGYWNKDDTPFVTSMSIVAGDCEEYLEGVSMQTWTVKANGIDAVAADKEQVDKMAAELAAALGVTTEYSVRMYFKPIEGTSELTYAITFDPVNAAQ